MKDTVSGRDELEVSLNTRVNVSFGPTKKISALQDSVNQIPVKGRPLSDSIQFLPPPYMRM